MSILAFEKLGKHYTINLARQGHDTLCDQLSYGFQSLIAMNTCFGSSSDNLSRYCFIRASDLTPKLKTPVRQLTYSHVSFPSVGSCQNEVELK